MGKNILCFSRSYLAYLMPEFGKRDEINTYFFIVQSSEEERVVTSKGGKVVFNIETYIKKHLKSKTPEVWKEPDDFREITNFYFSPVYSDRYLVNFSPAKRAEIAGGLYKGLSQVFKENRIDYLAGEPVAIFTTHLLFYLTIKHGGMPRLWSSTFFPKHFYFSENVKMSTAVEQNTTLDKESLIERKNTIRAYLEGIVEDKKGPAYHFSFAKKRSVLDTFFKTREGNSPIIVQPGISSAFLQFLRYFRAKLYSFLFPFKGDFQTAASAPEHWAYFRYLLTPKSYYDKMPSVYNDNAVLYPIQYEPEATLLYFSPDFSDQYVVVENILKSLPHDKLLYVKEHPNQFGFLGLPKWKKLRKKYHNLKYIYGRESGRELIKKCNFVTCISSSAGMDGLLFGKRVVLVGDVYYQSFTGAQKVYSYNELNRVLNNSETYNYQGHQLEDNVEDFMQLAERAHIGFPYSSQTLFEEENLMRITTAIQKEFV